MNSVQTLSDDGFLVDPESERARYSAQKLYTLPELQQYRALALLCEPGIGKSVTLEAEYNALRQQSADGQRPVQSYVDLRSFSSDVLLHSRVFGNPDFLAWKTGNSDLVLYLDSLDEALLRIDTVAAFLADELPQHPTARLSVRIACRTFVWPYQSLETAFARIWGEEAIGVFELAPLRRRDVADAAAQRGIAADRFIEEVQNANAVPFAIKPLTLNLLFRLYERDGSLPNRQVDLYAQGCLSLCEEHSPNRRGAGRLGQLNSHQRYRLAGRVAAVTMLANRYAVWTGPVGPDHLTSSELFALFTPPDDGFVGAYVMFVTQDLPRSLVGEDLIPAIEWATEYARSASLTNQFHTKQLADAVLVQAWNYIETALGATGIRSICSNGPPPFAPAIYVRNEA